MFVQCNLICFSSTNNSSNTSRFGFSSQDNAVRHKYYKKQGAEWCLLEDKPYYCGHNQEQPDEFVRCDLHESKLQKHVRNLGRKNQFRPPQAIRSFEFALPDEELRTTKATLPPRHRRQKKINEQNPKSHIPLHFPASRACLPPVAQPSHPPLNFYSHRALSPSREAHPLYRSLSLLIMSRSNRTPMNATICTPRA